MDINKFVSKAFPFGYLVLVVGAIIQLRDWITDLGWATVAIPLLLTGVGHVIYVHCARKTSDFDGRTKTRRYGKTDRLLSIAGLVGVAIILLLSRFTWPNESKAALEITAFDFTEKYLQSSTEGEYPQFDLKLRNTSDEAVFVTELRLKVLNTWTVRPTTFPRSKTMAAQVLPSAIYELEPGKVSRELFEMSGSDTATASIGALGQDPIVKDISLKVSHEVPVDGTDLIRLIYKVARVDEFPDLATGAMAKQVMISPFYFVCLSCEVVFNDGKVLESKPKLFVHFFSETERVAFSDVAMDDEFVEDGIPPLAVRYKNNTAAIREIRQAKCEKSPSVEVALKLTEENMAANPISSPSGDDTLPKD